MSTQDPDTDDLQPESPEGPAALHVPLSPSTEDAKRCLTLAPDSMRGTWIDDKVREVMRNVLRQADPGDLDWGKAMVERKQAEPNVWVLRIPVKSRVRRPLASVEGGEPEKGEPT